MSSDDSKPWQTSLIAPTLDLEEAFIDMAREWRADSDDRYREAIEGFTAYVTSLSAQARGVGLPPGRVPQSTFWLVRHDLRLLGCSRVRHWLVDHLRLEGGHVGYDVRPCERRKGYGTRLLELTLHEAGKLGLETVLVTCDDDNVASWRTIERNGGSLADRVVSARTGKLHRRYWIRL
jgi:predicted acetyltransferase